MRFCYPWAPRSRSVSVSVSVQFFFCERTKHSNHDLRIEGRRDGGREEGTLPWLFSCLQSTAILRYVILDILDVVVYLVYLGIWVSGYLGHLAWLHHHLFLCWLYSIHVSVSSLSICSVSTPSCLCLCLCVCLCVCLHHPSLCN